MALGKTARSESGHSGLRSAKTGRLSGRTVLAGLAVLLVVSLIISSQQGAFALSGLDLLGSLWRTITGLVTDVEPSGADLVFQHIRLPRLLLAIMSGAALALSGALMQGLFRNPLADPGLIGVSSGAALAASLVIVMGSLWLPGLPTGLGSWTLMVAAFGGGLLVTAVIYTFAQSSRGVRVGLMLLAGVAINALASAGLGLLNFMATDEQLRSLTFWLLGSLGNARWAAVLLVCVATVIGLVFGLRLARPLNALALGEAQAVLLGVPVERVKRQAILVTALTVGAVTATTGIIGFIGLVAPHAVRLMAGPNHRIVLPGSALLGASLVLLADGVARTIVQPAELPLGVLTACVGVPFFLLLLRAFKEKL